MPVVGRVVDPDVTDQPASTQPALLQPLTLRGVPLPHRLAVAPMCQYTVTDGLVGDYHLVHLGRFALGGFGLVMVEATGVSPEGRISYGDTGIWNDEQVEAYKRITAFVKAQGAVPAIQIAHAGRKASTPVPWRNGVPETDAEKVALGFE